MTEPPEHLGAAPLWRHLIAMFYDLFLIIPLLMLTTAVLVAIHGPTESIDALAVPAWQVWCLSFAALVGFFGTFWRMKGQTLGMQAWRVKLIAADGGNITWQQVILRIAVATPSLGIAGLGLLWRFIDNDRLAWHDRASGTRLVLLPKRKRG